MRNWRRPSIHLRRLASFVFSFLPRIVVSFLCRLQWQSPIPTQTLASPATTAIVTMPELFEDIVVEILLHLPPEDPRCLFRASLVCKLWRRLLTDAAFLRRYRRFHGAPPVLGFFYYDYDDNKQRSHGFIPTTTSASPFPQRALNRRGWCPIDYRHGRLLLNYGPSYMVRDTITGNLVDLSELWSQLPLLQLSVWNLSTAVLCAMAGCNHYDCHSGPFLVVWLCKELDFTSVFVYSSRPGSQIRFISIYEGASADANLSRGTVVGDGVYFTLQMGVAIPEFAILKYDFVKHHLSLIDPPPPEWCHSSIALMSTEDGLLGSAGIRGSSLHLWSRKANAEGVEGWVLYRVVYLQTLLPVDEPFTKATVIGYAEGVHAIFVSTDIGVFIIDLKSRQAKKVSNTFIHCHVVPLTRFYTPDRACTNLP